MTEILAVFRSRSHAIDCIGKLRAYKVAAQLISTPREANVGCGLSVKFSAAAFARVKTIISRENYPSFHGYLKITNYGGRILIG